MGAAPGREEDSERLPGHRSPSAIPSGVAGRVSARVPAGARTPSPFRQSQTWGSDTAQCTAGRQVQGEQSHSESLALPFSPGRFSRPDRDVTDTAEHAGEPKATLGSPGRRQRTEKGLLGARSQQKASPLITTHQPVRTGALTLCLHF